MSQLQECYQCPTGPTRDCRGLVPYGPLQEEEVSRLHAVDELLLWLVVPHVKCSSVEFVICWQRQDEGSMYVGSIDVFLELVLLWHRPVSGDETVHHDGLLRREVVTAAVPRDEGIDTLFQHDTHAQPHWFVRIDVRLPVLFHLQITRDPPLVSVSRVLSIIKWLRHVRLNHRRKQCGQEVKIHASLDKLVSEKTAAPRHGFSLFKECYETLRVRHDCLA
mmetsp:Transcript_850/g.2407  ORF Transcript_850/g.2407 Transcript_850/m.2407 type:complete len:220 (+) Transcript_850:101-760(+)